MSTDMRISIIHTMDILTTIMHMLIVTVPMSKTVTRPMPICMVRHTRSPMSICSLRCVMKIHMYTTTPCIQLAIHTRQTIHQITTPIPIRTRIRTLTILIPLPCLRITTLQYGVASPTLGVLPFKYLSMVL
jgi:hypothetical protein